MHKRALSKASLPVTSQAPASVITLPINCHTVIRTSGLTGRIRIFPNLVPAPSTAASAARSCMILKYLLPYAILFAASLLHAQEPPANPATSQSSVAETTEKGLDALKANQPQQALDLFEQALKSNPNDSAANLLAATAALSLYKGDVAVKYAEKARDLDPNNWKVHT